MCRLLWMNLIWSSSKLFFTYSSPSRNSKGPFDWCFSLNLFACSSDKKNLYVRFDEPSSLVSTINILGLLICYVIHTLSLSTFTSFHARALLMRVAHNSLNSYGYCEVVATESLLLWLLATISQGFAFLLLLLKGQSSADFPQVLPFSLHSFPCRLSVLFSLSTRDVVHFGSMSSSWTPALIMPSSALRLWSVRSFETFRRFSAISCAMSFSVRGIADSGLGGMTTSSSSSSSLLSSSLSTDDGDLCRSTSSNTDSVSDSESLWCRLRLGGPPLIRSWKAIKYRNQDVAAIVLDHWSVGTNQMGFQAPVFCTRVVTFQFQIFDHVVQIVHLLLKL